MGVILVPDNKKLECLHLTNAAWEKINDELQNVGCIVNLSEAGCGDDDVNEILEWINRMDNRSELLDALIDFLEGCGGFDVC